MFNVKFLQESISTGTLSDPSKSSGMTNGTASNKSSDLDWSTPLAGSSSGTDKSDAFGWDAHVSSQDTSDAFDWSTPLTNKVRFDDELELDLKLGSDSEEDEDNKGVATFSKYFFFVGFFLVLIFFFFFWGGALCYRTGLVSFPFMEWE